MCRSVGILVILLLSAACGDAMAQQSQRKVVVKAPVKHQVTRYLQSTGTLKAVNSVDLVARVSGMLEAVNFEDGEPVLKGDVVFVIEQEPYRISLATAEAELAQSQANLQQTSSNLIRQEQLLDRKAVAESVRENAVAQYEIAKAQVAAAKAKVRNAKLNLGYTEIRAPFDGILSARNADIGAYINAASAPKLATVVQPAPLHVLFSANERQVIEIRKALAKRNMKIVDAGPIRVEVGLQLDDAYPYSGTLDYVAPEIDTVSGTMTVRALLANPTQILSPGMFARVRVPLATNAAFAILETAIGTSQQGRTVFVVNQEGSVELRKVTVGDKLSGGLREIAQGLSAGDRVIVEGAGNVRPGETVTIVDQF